MSPISASTCLNFNTLLCVWASDKVIAAVACSTSRLPANHKVTVAWQIVFTFLPVVNFWAFYRIRKLRKYVLYVVLPTAITLLVVINEQPIDDIKQLVTLSYLSYHLVIAEQLIGIGIQGFAIYLVIIWSRQHNRQFDAPPATS
jgi:hypothetical protein